MTRSKDAWQQMDKDIIICGQGGLKNSNMKTSQLEDNRRLDVIEMWDEHWSCQKKKESKLKFKEQLTKDKKCVGNKQHFTFQFDKAAWSKSKYFE